MHRRLTAHSTTGRTRRLSPALVLVASALMVGIAGCSGGPETPAASADPQGIPDYYPADYQDLIDQSKTEDGLTIYSSFDSYNWDPIIKGFEAKYPWISNITTTNEGSAAVFTRNQAETESGSPVASLLVSGEPQSWKLASDGGYLADYTSPEVSKLPEFANPLPGVHTFSADVVVMAYNKAILGDKVPTTLDGIADLAESDPDKFRNKITTYSTESSFGLTIHYSYAQRLKEQGDDEWRTYERLAPFTQAESSSGPMLDKIATGEYLMGYFISSNSVFPQQQKLSSVVGWSYITDATPLFLKGIAVTKDAPAPATARLMLDYVLSAEGQLAVQAGGFTAYRDNVDPIENGPTYQSIIDEVGEKNTFVIGFGLDGTSDEIQDFGAKWLDVLAAGRG